MFLCPDYRCVYLHLKGVVVVVVVVVKISYPFMMMISLCNSNSSCSVLLSQELALCPSDENLFPEHDWLIGNHSDELTPWIPVIAAR